MLTLDDNFTVIRVKAGEPILIDIQLCDATGVVQSLKAGNRKIIWSLFTSARAGVDYRNLPIGTDDSGDFARLVIDGLESDDLYGNENLLWQFIDRLDNGREVIGPTDAPGSMVVEISAPRVDDNDDAPIARYIWRVQRWYNYDTGKLVKWTKKIIPYVPLPADAPAQSSSASANFSDANNSQYAVLV